MTPLNIEGPIQGLHYIRGNRQMRPESMLMFLLHALNKDITRAVTMGYNAIFFVINE